MSGAAGATATPDAAASRCSGRRTWQAPSQRRCRSPKISIRSVTSVRTASIEVSSRPPRRRTRDLVGCQNSDMVLTSSSGVHHLPCTHRRRSRLTPLAPPIIYAFFLAVRWPTPRQRGRWLRTGRDCSWVHACCWARRASRSGPVAIVTDGAVRGQVQAYRRMRARRITSSATPRP
jgi:hypothetical protein